MDFREVFRNEQRSELTEIRPRYFADNSARGSWQDVHSDEMGRLLKQVREGRPWQDVVYEHTSTKGNQWLEQIVLSPSRSLFLELLPLSGSDVVLDIGSGWGQLTRELARRAKAVVSVEPNPERLTINEQICAQEQISNICFFQSSDCTAFLKDESFDFILLCGVYEWLAQEQSGDPRSVQQQLLHRFQKLLKPGGTVIIAIENRVGLKYLLGENDDHSSVRHVSYLPYAEAKAMFETETLRELRAFTYSQKEYQQQLTANGFENVKFFAAFPDYKIPQCIVPADSPEVLRDLISRLALPDEHDGTTGALSSNSEIIHRVYRALGDLEITQLLAPSFIITAERAL